MSEVETKVTETTESTEPKKEPEKTPEVDVQELMTQLAKLKRANDKLSSESAEWKKKYQATLSEQEKASEEKAEREAEREEQYQKLLRENTINKIEKAYLGQGWTASEASRMAIAEADGDFDGKMKITAEVEARKAKDVMTEFLKSRPDIQYGTGKSGMTKEQFDKMVAKNDVAGLTKFKREHPDEYARYMKSI